MYYQRQKFDCHLVSYPAVVQRILDDTMKRLLEVESRVVAEELVALAPEIAEDATETVALLFSAVNPLLEILWHRPILLINLSLW